MSRQLREFLSFAVTGATGAVLGWNRAPLGWAIPLCILTGVAAAITLRPWR